jgi:hypothetical protein
MAPIASFRLLSEQGRVPSDKGGLYFFKLRFPSNYELGLMPDRAADLQHVLRTAAAYIEKVEKIATYGPLTGELSDGEKAPHMQTLYHLSAAVISTATIRTSVDQLVRNSASRGKLDAALGILRLFFDYVSPLYIGMTERQSLSDRLNQHTSGGTLLYERLALCGIDWTELTFCCLPLDELNRTEVRALEKLFQSFCKPRLSIS